MKSLIVLAAAFLLPLTVFAQPNSVPRQPTSSVAFAQDPAVAATGSVTVTADFNGDGKLDLATTDNKHGGVTIRLGNGNGTFLPGVTYRTGYSFDGLVVGDFNGDGKLDLALSFPTLCGGCGGYPSYQLQVLLGAGDGTFPTLVAPKYPFYGLPLAAGDFNGDGKLDLIVTSTSYDGTDWFPKVVFGKGNGLFETGPSLGDPFALTYPAVGDFNGDGKLDIALPAMNEYQGLPITDVFLGNGDGTFASPAQYAGANEYGYHAAVGDFNGDGKFDIVTDAVQVLLNNGDGTFSNDSNVNFNGAGGVVIGDFNGDGKLDFASIPFPGPGPNTASVFLGNNDGTFQTVTTQGAPVVAAGDFNSDGKLDLLTTNGIYLQTPAAVAPTVVNFGDVTVGTTSSPQTVSLTNVGNMAMKISGVSLTGTNPSDYQIISNGCGSSLNPGKSCQVVVEYAPTTGGDQYAYLTVSIEGAPASQTYLEGAGF